MRIQKYYTSKEYTPDFRELADIKSIGAKDRVFHSVKSVLEDDPGVILDVGCGNGVIAKQFKRDNLVIGLEINRELANKAKVYFDVILCDAESSWPIKDGGVDVVYMGAFLEHVFDYDFILSESRRVLKTGGKLIILIPNGVNLKDRVIMLFGNQPEWYRIKGHIRFWTLPWLRKATEEHGFKELYAIGFPYPTKEWIHKIRILNPFFSFLERKFPGLCKLLIWKGEKI